MNNVKVLIFCAVTLAAALGACVGLARAVMVPEGRVQTAAIPQPVEAFQKPIDVGAGLGHVRVSRLMEYFIAHPPQTGAGQGPVLPVQHFGGC